MDSSAQFFLTIGGILLLGLLTTALSRHTFLPRVTLLLIFGITIGEEVLGIIPNVFADHFEIIADMTLLVVGFLLGGKLTKDSLQSNAKKILWISLCSALMTTALVASLLMLFGVNKEIAIILGCIASATAPAAVMDAVNESSHKGPFGQLLLSIVAIDDIWAMILFGFGIATVSTLNGHAGEESFLFITAKEIGGAVALGILLGLPAAYLTGRVKPCQPILAEALGLVFICGGLALTLEVSHLIAAIVMGAVISNLAKHHDYPFHAIEGIEWPFMVVFFVLAGASLELSALQDLGLVGGVYIACRSIGKYLGAYIGGQLSHAEKSTKNWIGLALFPQAGVPIGMALVASHQFPEYRQMLLTIVISSTVFFEIAGPICTRIALEKAQG